MLRQRKNAKEWFITNSVNYFHARWHTVLFEVNSSQNSIEKKDWGEISMPKYALKPK